MKSFKELSSAFKIAVMKRFYTQKSLDEKLLKAVNDDIAIVDRILTIEKLIAYGANPNANDGAILQQAVRTERTETIFALLNNGADIHLSNEKALRTAMQNRQSEIAFILIQNGANPEAAVAYLKSQPRSAETANALDWYDKVQPHIDKMVKVQRAQRTNPPPVAP